MTKRNYEGDGIVVHWDSGRCIHGGNCLRALPEVFDTRRRPWIDVTAADADTIARAVEVCPSGALRYERTDGTAGEAPDVPTTIIPLPNGPLVVRGNVEVRDRRGNVFTDGPRLALCRCGASKNHPYCDLSHVEAGFKNYPRATSPERESAESPHDVGPELQ